MSRGTDLEETPLETSQLNVMKEADVSLTEREINLLIGVLPEIVVREKRFDARQALFKTGRAERLESVLKKLR